MGEFPTRIASGVMASSHTTMACEFPFRSCWPQAPTSSAGTSSPASPAVRYQSQMVAAVAAASSPNHSGGQPRIGMTMASSGGYRYWFSCPRSDWPEYGFWPDHSRSPARW